MRTYPVPPCLAWVNVRAVHLGELGPDVIVEQAIGPDGGLYIAPLGSPDPWTDDVAWVRLPDGPVTA